MSDTNLKAILDDEGRKACVFARDVRESATTYFGGLPRFPSDHAWPRHSQSGASLHFLAQIDCAGLPRFTESYLPPEGILYFFALMDEDLIWDRPQSGEAQAATRVLYSAIGAGAPERSAPATLPALYGGSDYRYRKPEWLGDWAFDRAPGQTVLPKNAMRSVETVSFPDAFAFGIYNEPCRQYRKLADSRLVADLAEKDISIADATGRLLKHQMLGAPAWMQGAEDLHESKILLLQLDSDHLMEWLWADVGMAQFWIDPADLASCRFGRAFATLGSS